MSKYILKSALWALIIVLGGGIAGCSDDVSKNEPNLENEPFLTTYFTKLNDETKDKYKYKAEFPIKITVFKNDEVIFEHQYGTYLNNISEIPITDKIKDGENLKVYSFGYDIKFEIEMTDGSPLPKRSSIVDVFKLNLYKNTYITDQKLDYQKIYMHPEPGESLSDEFITITRESESKMTVIMKKTDPDNDIYKTHCLLFDFVNLIPDKLLSLKENNREIELPDELKTYLKFNASFKFVIYSKSFITTEDPDRYNPTEKM